MVSREELYRLVWSQPMTKIAEQFDVSGSYLARVCTLLNVPRPERGYWAKLGVGKAAPQAPLPPRRAGDPVHWIREDEASPLPRPSLPPSRDPKRPVRIARNRIHPLIRQARTHFEHCRPCEDGALLKPYKKLMADITASEASVEKALGLANDLFNALESVGHRVVLAPSDAQFSRDRIDERETANAPRNYWEHSGLWSPYRPTIVYIGTVAVGLAIIEMSETITLRYVNGKYIRDSEYAPRRKRYRDDLSWTTNRDLPSGRLRIVAYSPYGRVSWSVQWQESKSSSLRGQIKAIVETIELAAPELVLKLEDADREAEVRRQHWLEQEERQRREEDRRKAEQSVADSKLDLRQIIAKWADVMSVERFLAGVEERVGNLPAVDRKQMLERLALARDFIGSQDPMDFFRIWKTPLERYAPQYSDHKPSET